MNKEFYNQCGEILGVNHEYHTPYPYKTRWNSRTLGNGRYPGFGTIQIFGPDNIRVICKQGTSMFKTYDEVYNFLESHR